MAVNPKIQSIDQKIANLKKRKAQLAQQHLMAHARLVQKCGLADLTPETLAGALLEIKQQASLKKEEWQHAGEVFLQPTISAKAQKSTNQIAEN